MTDPMRLLAEARPADLDPPTAPPRGELGAIMAHARRRPAAARSRRGFALGLAGTAALAAVTVAAVAATQLGGPPGPGPAPRAEPPPRVLTASEQLLAAAERTEPDAGSGRYWVHRTIDWRLDQARAASGDFVVVVRSRWESWSAMTAGQPSWFINQPLSVRPATPADEEAWKRAGSPGEITLDGKAGRITVPMGEGRRSGYSVDSLGRSFSFGHGVLSLTEVRALPADPGQLRAALLRHRNPDTVQDETAYLFDSASHLIVGTPVTSEVRAAAYRLLGGLPGIRAETGVKDVAGRAGVAVVRPDTDALGGSLERWLIINPGTGRALATEVRYTRPAGPLAWVPPGAVYRSRVVENAGFTNDAPPAI